MASSPKENFSVHNLQDFRNKIDSEVALSEIKFYLQSVFIKIQDTLSVLNMQLHLLHDFDFSVSDGEQKDFLSHFLVKLEYLSKGANSGEIALHESFPDMSAFGDKDFCVFAKGRQDEFNLKLRTIEQITDEEFFETLSVEFRFLFASAEHCIAATSLIGTKEELFSLSEEISLAALSLDFLARFFEKWLQNKGIFIQ